jgi:hypothetical protein
MNMSDHEFDQMLVRGKRYFMRVARPVALALLAYVLGTAQGYFSYPNLLLAFVVLVLASSTYGARSAYAIVLFLTFLILLPPEAMNALQKVLASIAGRAL